MSNKTWIDTELILSPAFISLSGFASTLLLILFTKRKFNRIGIKKSKKYVCVNCNSLNISYVEYENSYGITQPRLTRAIDDLLAKGFLECKHAGGACKQDKSVYAFSDQWVLWQPGMIIFTRLKDGIKRGFRTPK
uniref:Uncharacterized protein n=1 Tax=Candidatus Desulfatibia profunda TaxID=2841695 RepID=A0A8J6TGP2_9BACT|nr:hypothetical protein [Candidatus Desulfatibia profunda]